MARVWARVSAHAYLDIIETQQRQRGVPFDGAALSGAITFKEFAEVMNKDEHADNKSNWFVGGGHARNKKKRNNVASIVYK